MHSSQPDFRELFDLIRYEDSRPVYRHVLAPWAESHAGEREWLQSFASRRGNPIPQAEIEDLWTLYALSRVNETLLLGFQRGRADGSDWPGPKISADEYLRFADSLGLTVTREERTELLINRCFLRTAKPHVDLWPYDDVLRARP